MRKAADYVILGFFLLAIGVPFAWLFVGAHQRADLREGRLLAVRPKISLQSPSLGDFPRRFTEYVNDQYCFRSGLIWCRNFLLTYVLKCDPADFAVLGQEGWWFGNWQREMDYFQGREPFSDDSLQAWAEVLQRRQSALAALGIRYLMVIVPNKSTIYPEFLPSRIKKISSTTRLDQLLERVRRGSEMPILDLRRTLIDAKRLGLLYRKTDTHWNQLGAFVAYEKILETLSCWFPTLRPNPLSAFQMRSEMLPGGDIVSTLGLEKLAFEDVPCLIPTFERQPAAKESLPSQEVVVRETDREWLPSAVIFHDSFIRYLDWLLVEHFNRLIFVPENKKFPMRFDLDLVRKEKPDLVLELFVERRLMDPSIWGY